MSKIFKLSTALFTMFVVSSAHAASDGFYIGANAGWSIAEYYVNAFPYMVSAKIQQHGFALGGVFGYQFSPLLATEFGYTHTFNVKFSDISMASNTPGGITTLSDSRIALSIFDIAARGMIPLKYGFGLNGKIGAAYVKPTVTGGMNNPTLGSAYSNASRVLPELGVGASYDINKNVTTGINATRIFKSGNIPNIDLFMFNLGYHFG